MSGSSVATVPFSAMRLHALVADVQQMVCRNSPYPAAKFSTAESDYLVGMEFEV